MSPPTPAKEVAADARRAGDTAARQRRLQEQQNLRDAGKPEHPKRKRPVQAGARVQPDMLPEQTLQKPGVESELVVRPCYLAPDYRGSGKLQDKVALITGGDSGIGRAVAVLFAREGADVAVMYIDEDDDALETMRNVEAEGRRCMLLGSVGAA